MNKVLLETVRMSRNFKDVCFSALIIYGALEDYSRRFQQKGDDFFVDGDNFMLRRDNNSLIIAFPSGGFVNMPTVIATALPPAVVVVVVVVAVVAAMEAAAEIRNN